MRNHSTLVILLILTLTTLSCSDDDVKVDVINGVWIVQSLQPIGGQRISSENIGFYLEFIDDDSYGISLDVNQCGGIYAITGDNLISFDPSLCTQKGGDSAEAFVFRDILTRSNTFSLDEDQLTILGPDGEVQLKRLY